MSAWQSIRILRARPPAGVTDERQAVFVSALEQSEQLMRAAHDVGPAARPLPLFYALSQAGRAIAAAHLPDGGWRLAGHGLTCRPPHGRTDLLRRVVGPQQASAKTLALSRPSSFAGVSNAIGSQPLSGDIELGAVWFGVPDLVEPLPQMPDRDLTWRRPLRVFSPYWDEDDANPAFFASQRLELLVSGLPIDPDANAMLDADPLLAELIDHDPSSSGVHAVPPARGMTNVQRRWAPNRECLPTFCWPGVQALDEAALERIAPDYRARGQRLMLPRLNGKDAPAPLMLWWLLLFGLSSVARYDPELWVAVLDVNTSEQAVPLEAALDEALDVLPELILTALT